MGFSVKTEMDSQKSFIPQCFTNGDVLKLQVRSYPWGFSTAKTCNYTQERVCSHRLFISVDTLTSLVCLHFVVSRYNR